MINLPDVIPSIIYDATNTYSSRFVSCGKTIDGITGEALYAGNDVYNHRLDQTEFMMPVLYSMAPRLCAAQQAALKEGNTLVLYEAYRPHETQRKVADAMWALTRKDAEGKRGGNRRALEHDLVYFYRDFQSPKRLCRGCQYSPDRFRPDWENRRL